MEKAIFNLTAFPISRGAAWGLSGTINAVLAGYTLRLVIAASERDLDAAWLVLDNAANGGITLTPGSSSSSYTITATAAQTAASIPATANNCYYWWTLIPSAGDPIVFMSGTIPVQTARTAAAGGVP